ncbi:GNAT family N-acetyltransferase [Rhizohabitans arisaemae]|uniref:GNAT family N-acetyltransferase n=1 Tax=Rhizohabitans arisaemae TaxID=2720610 RepID=UPI0024B2354D|nr:GNAT family N-acetyltransferase [Rhizohabitans arisaemae]
MQITVTHPNDLGERERRRWRELQGSTPSLDNAFLSVEFTLAMGALRDHVRVAVINDGPDIVGFFPYERHPFGIGRPLGGFLTTCHAVISDRDLELDGRELLRGCGLNVFEFDHLVPGQRAFAPYQSGVHPVPVMDLTSGFETWAETVRAASPKNFKTIRYKERKLGREHGELRFVWAAADPALLDRLMRWKSDQYRRTGRVDRFARPWIVALLKETHRHRSEDFAGCLTMLYAGDTPIAGHFGLRTKHTLVGWFPAYDDAYSGYSPGMVHHLRLAEAAAQAGLHSIDMGKGGKEYKGWLKSGQSSVAEGRISRPSLAASAHWLGRVPFVRTRALVLSHPGLYRRADRVLKGFARLRAPNRP